MQVYKRLAYDGVMTTDPSMREVDDLLSQPIPGSRPGINAPMPVRDEMDTGVYDTTFFMGTDALPVSPLERLADAKVGLTVFLEEAGRALEAPNDELTPDQRVHVATIVSYIEALGTRFDVIRTPGFTQKRKSRRP